MRARFKEGYSQLDFLAVIHNKVAEWGNDPKWSKYLTPETLFAPSHFDNYLNQSPVKVGSVTERVMAKLRAQELDGTVAR
jgi:hypothetical protein